LEYLWGESPLTHPDNDRVTDVIRTHWNGRAKNFDNERGHGVHSDEQHRAWLTLLARIAGPEPLNVLDVGCGTGVLSLMLDELGHSVTGIDVAAGMLEQAQRKAADAGARISFRIGNASQLNDPDSTYDLVIARHVIWTLPDPAKAVSEWMRVLRPGGRIALIEGKWASKETEPRYVRPGALQALRSQLVYAALRLIAATTGKKHWRLYAREYRELAAQLPFSGGPPAERLADALRKQGLKDVTVEPLMNAELWEEVPPFPRYLVVCTR
jgi:ubiquinone/menaquinone biosynthesis C-methylase UbiE